MPDDLTVCGPDCTEDCGAGHCHPRDHASEHDVSKVAAVADALISSWSVADDPTSQAMARRAAERDARTVLAALATATDPGGDLHRRTVEHLGQAWPDLTEDPVYLDQLAHEALSVRWEHAVHQADEVERLRTANKTLADMMERIPETHMRFGLLLPDGTEEPATTCADWCWACRVDRAEAKVEQLRYERRLLGAARMVLDLIAAGDPARLEQLRQEAGDIAQRIVDEIGHPVTDEPALGPSYRAELERLRARNADLESALNWQTSCTACAKTLDASIKETERAEKAEAATERVRALAENAADGIFGRLPPSVVLAALSGRRGDTP